MKGHPRDYGSIALTDKPKKVIARPPKLVNIVA